jgi:Fe-S cluster assembly iron-binding protein IscA
MLQISDSAETALRRIRQENDFPETAAVRIGPVRTPAGEVGIGFAFTDGPEENDEILSEREEFRVYLAEELAAPLGDAALDASSDEEGITLELRTQAQLENHESEERS